MQIAEALQQGIDTAAMPEGIRLRIATPGDFAALSSINAEAVRFVGEDMYGRQDEAFFEQVTDQGAGIVLIMQSGLPMGYSIAGAAARMARLFADRPDRGLMFGTALRAGLRGYGWQRRMIRMRQTALFQCGFAGALAFVSPWNHRSLHNLLTEGCAVRGYDFTYYSRDRFIVEAPAVPLLYGERRDAVPLPPDGPLTYHDDLLRAGCHGVALERRGDTAHMVYRMAG